MGAGAPTCLLLRTHPVTVRAPLAAWFARRPAPRAPGRLRVPPSAAIPMLRATARILAAADVYQALIETRPHRAALTAEAAADELRREVAAGRLDGDAA